MTTEPTHPALLPERWEVSEERDRAIESVSTVLDAPWTRGYKHAVADTCEDHLHPDEPATADEKDPNEPGIPSVDHLARIGYRAGAAETRAWLAGHTPDPPLDGI